MHSTRQGFLWWEFDLTYYSLRVLSWLGVIWSMREPGERALRGPFVPSRTVGAG
jgi:stearoyl-CoA desaturase (delta-9 desaturase)